MMIKKMYTYYNDNVNNFFLLYSKKTIIVNVKENIFLTKKYFVIQIFFVLLHPIPQVVTIHGRRDIFRLRSVVGREMCICRRLYIIAGAEERESHPHLLWGILSTNTYRKV